MGKAARLKEQHRLERERQMAEDEARAKLEEFFNRMEEFTNTVEDQPHGPYFSCTYKMEHDEDCDTSCEQLTKWDMAVMHEKERWRRANMDPANVSQDIFAMDISLQTIVAVMIDKGIIDQQELNNLYANKMFETLLTLRERFQPQIEQTRRESIAVKSMPGILGPNGRPLN